MPKQTDYQQHLEEKTKRTLDQFSAYLDDTKSKGTPLDVFASPPTGYRMRAEFRIWHEDDDLFYGMHDPKPPHAIVKMTTLDIAHSNITALMPNLLNAIKQIEPLKHRLFQCEFLTSTLGEQLVTLIYHRPLDESWDAYAHALAQQFQIHVVGRSKGIKRVIGANHIYEQFMVQDTCFRYQQIEASFTQPNAHICSKMLNWADGLIEKSDRDFLELYCGNGNFTLPLARKFRKVLATEISKTSIQSALHNCDINKVGNIEFVRMSSEEFGQALQHVRPFTRLRHVNLDDYDFSTVLVDPPRAGLDSVTCQLIAQFEHILYISCNPDTLERDLNVLSKTHQVVKAALFDQFPGTEHREMGLYLSTISLSNT